MQFEVEQKFVAVDPEDLARRIERLGASVAEPIHQLDVYYAHPSRNFAQTDEALRIRRVGMSNCVTYKGPKIDATTKTRREIEVPLGDGAEAAAGFAQLLESLGFFPVGRIKKRRRGAVVRWEDRRVTIALDDVEGVGHYIELEQMADARDLDSCRASLGRLADELGLSGSERRSYLELLLEKSAGSDS